jgi:hypothetical protein
MRATLQDEPRGRTISIRFFLNTRVKPKLDGEEKRYPVYVRVICKKQVSDFPTTDNWVTFKDFKAYLDDSPEKNHLIVKYILQLSYSIISYNITAILGVVRPFERENFKLAALPEVYRIYKDVAQSVNYSVNVKYVKEALERKGYGLLTDVIDWNKDIFQIVDVIHTLQEEKLVKSFKIDIRPLLRFEDVVLWLENFIDDKKRYPDTAAKREKFIEHLKEKKVFQAGKKEDYNLIVSQAVDFAAKASKMLFP